MIEKPKFNRYGLLKRAAKAADYRVYWNPGYDRVELLEPVTLEPTAPEKPNNRRTWDPITDDGDALRLAVDLRLSVKHGVCIFDDKKQPSAYVYFNNIGECVFEPHGDDPRAATRLAIVRAAAHIGARQQ